MSSNIPTNLDTEIKQLIAEIIGTTPEELRLETNLWNDLGVDSIKAIALTVAIERKYKVTVRDEQIPQITTVGQIIGIVKDVLRKKENGK